MNRFLTLMILLLAGTLTSVSATAGQGVLSGTVDESLMSGGHCDNDMDAGDAGTMLLYDAVAVAALRQLSDAGAAVVIPVAEVPIVQNLAGDYEYTFRDVSPGDYYLAINCEDLPAGVASLFLSEQFSDAVAVFDGRLSEFSLSHPGTRPVAEKPHIAGIAGNY